MRIGHVSFMRFVSFAAASTLSLCYMSSPIYVGGRGSPSSAQPIHSARSSRGRGAVLAAAAAAAWLGTAALRAGAGLAQSSRTAEHGAAAVAVADSVQPDLPTGKAPRHRLVEQHGWNDYDVASHCMCNVCVEQLLDRHGGEAEDSSVFSPDQALRQQRLSAPSQSECPCSARIMRIVAVAVAIT